MSLMSATVRLLRDFSSSLVASISEAPGLTQIDLRWAEHGDSLSTDRDNKYQYLQWYYDGYQRDPLGADFNTNTIPLVRPNFAGRHNFLAVVVDVMIERMNVTGFTVTTNDAGESPANEAADSAIGKLLWQWWQENRMDEMQATVHAQTLIKGDAYVFVDWDNDRNRPRFTYNDAMAIEGSGQTVTPVYDANHQLDAVYKTWVERYADDQHQVRIRQRITKYTKGYVEKYAREGQGGVWRVWTQDLDADGQPDGGIILWQDAGGQPLGIPVFHFRNKPRGNDFGRSEIDDLIPAQDSYNDRHLSTDEAFRLSGNAQKYAVNVTPPDGGWASGPDVVWRMDALDPNKPVAVGQFTPGNVTEMQNGVDLQLKTIAAMSRTPLYILWPEGRLPPSGEALKVAESGLTAKCEDRSVSFGNVWEDVLKFAIRLQNTWGTGAQVSEDLIISTQWASAATRSELMDTQVAVLMADQISSQEFLRRVGYNEHEIEKIQAEKDAATPPALRQADMFAQSAMAGPGAGQAMPTMGMGHGGDTATAVAQLQAAIALHARHMNGTEPTTGPAGDKSQQKMMDEMKAALAALTGGARSSGGKMAMMGQPQGAP